LPEYYKTVHSLSELLGDKGLLRLPENLHELYVFDKKRQESINVAIDTLKKGEKNVLIVGKAGTGKTAFMFMVLRKLIEDEGYSIGVIYDGVDFLMTEHVENNVILFYDDLPTMKESALQSILKNNVHNIICTSREEELRKIRKIFGRHLEQMFEVIKIERMTPECIEKIFDKYINFEGILVKGDYEVIKKKIVEKSEGLPIYIGQLVRELKISNKPLDNNFAAKIPTGMYKYVEDILYRVLDDDPDAFSILTVLRIMADLKKGIIHQNLYDHLFLVVKKFNDKQDYGLTQVLEIPTFIKFTRYLFRVPQKFAYRFPHDSWSDVVRGKASGAMAEAIEEILGDRISEGLINVLKGTETRFKTRRIKLNGATHPIPGEEGRKGVEKMLEIAKKAGEKDLVIVLISGGGSALMPYPAPPITLEEKKKVTSLLLKCGATINEINAVRKHISMFKGGQLARACYPATTVALIISDVVGDPLDTIASGPTAPDNTTFQDAYRVLKYYDLLDKVPASVKERIEKGLKGEIEDTPKPGDKIFEKVRNLIIANNRTALDAAVKKAKEYGLNTMILSTFIEGEARHVGTVFAGIARELYHTGTPINKPAFIAAGGETTVTVVGSGKGGRNQELVLSAAIKINGLDGVAIASIGTDGIDGITDAAGGIVDGSTLVRGKEKNLEILDFLANNDSYNYLTKTDDIIITGPTGSNVNDIMFIVVL